MPAIAIKIIISFIGFSLYLCINRALVHFFLKSGKYRFTNKNAVTNPIGHMFKKTMN